MVTVIDCVTKLRWTRITDKTVKILQTGSKLNLSYSKTCVSTFDSPIVTHYTTHFMLETVAP